MVPVLLSPSLSQLSLWAFGLILVLGFLELIRLLLGREMLARAMDRFPGPPTHWLFGHALDIWQMGRLVKVVSWAHQFPYTHPLWLRQFLGFLNIYDTDFAKAVYSRGDPKVPFVYNCFLQWIGNGLLVLEGQTWFQHRRMLTPAFHYDILKPYNMRTKVDSQQVWGRAQVRRNSSKLLILLIDPERSPCTHPALHPHSSTGTQRRVLLIYLSLGDMRNLSHQNDIIYRLTPEGRWSHRTCQLAHQHTDGVIQLRKAHLQKERELEKVRSKRHLDFLDILLFARVSVGRRGLRLCPEAQRKGRPCTPPASADGEREQLV
uniref:Cytochrome P450 n=1 Tax=Phocoena sinus TaxID=42100 RepID=A0A8C9BIV4_PHOSS